MEWRHLAAELIGTMILVFSFAATRGNPFATGAGLFVAYSTTGLISGGHFNPAVTIAFMLTKGIRKLSSSEEMIKFVLYIIVQFIGAFLGALIAWGLSDQTWSLEVGTESSNAAAVMGEMIVTAILCVMALVAIEIPGNELVGTLGAPIAMFYGVFAIGPISGGAFNPALGIVANIVSSLEGDEESDMDDAWIYLIGPVTGALIGSFIFLSVKNAIVSAHGSSNNKSVKSAS
jgi:aquaporin Z